MKRTMKPHWIGGNRKHQNYRRDVQLSAIETHQISKVNTYKAYTMLDIFIYYNPPQFSSDQLARFMLLAYIHKYSQKNSVDPDQLASEKPFDLDLHCF